jgi:chorismate mutase
MTGDFFFALKCTQLDTQNKPLTYHTMENVNSTKVRGVRGAITVEKDQGDLILDKTKVLLSQLFLANEIQPDDVASIFFSLTPDLHKAFPAVAARQLEWNDVPLFCMQELDIEGALPHCIRVLIHWNTDKAAQQIQHLYLEGAKVLRPDLSKAEPK